MTDRAKYRKALADELYIGQRDRNRRGITGHSAAAAVALIIERELSLFEIELDDDERRTIQWLCNGEISTLATIVALIVAERK